MAYTLSYELIDDNAHYRVTGVAEGTADNVVIPAEYNSKPVTEIADGAFKGTSLESPNTTLVSITIPDSVTKIGSMTDDSPSGSGAFAFCTALTTVNMGKNVRIIGRYTFAHCESLTRITLPNGVTSIGDFAFEVSGLTGISIPNSVTTMGESVFFDCENLKAATIGSGLSSIPLHTFKNCGLQSINIPRNIVSIGVSAFLNCSDLRTVIFNDGLLKIGAGAFGYCTNLTPLVLPKTLTNIGGSAFYGCTAITEVIIPTSVAAISYEVFMNCSNLETVTLLRDNPPEAGSTIFDGIHPNATLYCYSTAIDNYKTAANLDRYANKFKADDLKIDFLLFAKSTKSLIDDRTGTSVDANFFDDIYSRV